MRPSFHAKAGAFAQDRDSIWRHLRAFADAILGGLTMRGLLPRASRRAFRPILLPLEGRKLMSSLPSAPTADEQYMLQLINRARANPQAEGQRLIALAKTDPVLKNAVQGWDLSAFLQQISSIPALPPLAFNTRLIAAARDQDAVMLATNNQAHAPSGFLVTGTSGRVAGDGQVYYPVASNQSWATGENLFAYSGNVNRPTVKDYVDYYEAGLLIDWGNPDFGHLKNLLAPGPSQSTAMGQLPYSEIGIGLLSNVSPKSAPPTNPENAANRGLNVGPVLVAQEFGWRSGNAFLTGAVYRDSDSNGFYTPGEGLGGVAVVATGLHGEGTFQTVTWDSGGYSLPLPPGTYSVTISGNNAPAHTATIAIGQDNVGWDIQYNAATPATPTPAATPPQTAAAPPAASARAKVVARAKLKARSRALHRVARRPAAKH